MIKGLYIKTPKIAYIYHIVNNFCSLKLAKDRIKLICRTFLLANFSKRKLFLTYVARILLEYKRHVFNICNK